MSVRWTLVNVAGFTCVLVSMASKAQFHTKADFRRPVTKAFVGSQYSVIKPIELFKSH